MTRNDLHFGGNKPVSTYRVVLVAIWIWEKKDERIGRNSHTTEQCCCSFEAWRNRKTCSIYPRTSHSSLPRLSWGGAQRAWIHTRDLHYCNQIKWRLNCWNWCPTLAFKPWKSIKRVTALTPGEIQFLFQCTFLIFWTMSLSLFPLLYCLCVLS